MFLRECRDFVQAGLLLRELHAKRATCVKTLYTHAAFVVEKQQHAAMYGVFM